MSGYASGCFHGISYPVDKKRPVHDIMLLARSRSKKREVSCLAMVVSRVCPRPDTLCGQLFGQCDWGVVEECRRFVLRIVTALPLRGVKYRYTMGSPGLERWGGIEVY